MAFWYLRRLSLPAILLWPLSLLVRLVAWRKRAVRNNSDYLVPVVVVGNITVGGTGKTPMIIWLVNMLQKAGYSVGVVSRGYGATDQPAYPYSLTPDSPVSSSGDEPKLIQSRTGCSFVVDPKRHRAVESLISQFNPDVIISDDGMQHYAMHRDVEILMVDAARKFGNGHLMPAGPLRESLSRLDTVDFIVAKGGAVPELKGSFEARLKVDEPENALNERLPACQIKACSGIGNFQSFLDSLASLGFDVVESCQFRDHEVISDEALTGPYPIVITEKDAVKLDLSSKPNVYILGLNLQLSEQFEVAVRNKIEEQILEKSRRHSRPL